MRCTPVIVSCLNLFAVGCRPDARFTPPVADTAPPSAAGEALAGFELVTDETPRPKWPAAEAGILTNVRQLTDESLGITRAGEAYFSPDMRRIIFQAYPTGESVYQMYTLELDRDGAAVPGSFKQVSPGGGACTCGFFAPDGQSIIYASSYLNPDLPNPNEYQRSGSTYVWPMPGGMDIIRAELDGSNPRQLTQAVGYDAECAYNAAGDRIVFCSDRDGDPDLYVMNADGTGVRQLTNQPGYDGGPFFSPDGRRIVFRADRADDQCLQLFVINADGSGERQLTRLSKAVNWAPFWLPGGRSVVFTTSLHGHHNYEVYLLNVDTGLSRRVTFRDRFDGLPVISPDGKWMMWTSQRGESAASHIFLADFRAPEGF